MRTSRISRESARLASALKARSSRPPSAKLEEATGESSVKQEPVASPSPFASPRLKRKREIEEDLTKSVPAPDINVQNADTRSSPRKAEAKNEGRPKKAKRQPAKRIADEDGQIKIEPPPGWEMMYETTRQMRAMVLAPVDTMGCESLAEDHRSPRDRRFQTLVALMLSSQTKDTVTAVAMKKLQDGLEGGFTLEAILKVEPDELNELISKVGFHNNKTKFIKATAIILRDQFDSDIPDTITGLISLPGVGPKMAYLCMSAAWGRDEGIGVDVHVHRITNLWGWHKTSNPEETRAALESWLPRDKWHDINHLLVGFGQTWCPPVGRKCGECRLAEENLCPSAVVGKAVKSTVKKREVKEETRDARAVVKREVAIEMDIKDIKAEDLEDTIQGYTHIKVQPSVPDIEDLVGRRRSARIVR